MKAADFYRHLETEAVAPVYLFVGNAELQIEEAWSRLLKAIVPESARRFNGERLRAREVPAPQVMSLLETLPMFGHRRLVMVQHIENWAKDQQKLLLAYLQKPIPTSCLVLTLDHAKGMDKLEAAVEAVGIVVRFASLTEWDAPRWLQNRARTQGKQLTAKAAAFLTEWVGLDEQALGQELEKLLLYVGESATIDMAEVQEVASFQRTFTSFEMMRLVGQKDTSKALTALRKLLLAGEAPLAVLGLLARQVRLIWQVKDGTERGMGTPELGRRLNLYPKVLSQYAEQARTFSQVRLEEFHEAIRASDVLLKSSGVSPEMIMESLVISMCLPQKNEPRDTVSRGSWG
jgi:DNA polymerase-3 subunit delta